LRNPVPHFERNSMRVKRRSPTGLGADIGRARNVDRTRLEKPLEEPQQCDRLPRCWQAKRLPTL
jgi:hypothetical protein